MAVRTLVEVYDSAIARPRPDLLQHKSGGSYRPTSTSEFSSRVRGLSYALTEMGVAEGDRVGLLSENRPEWSIADFAILNAGAATVPIYATLLPEQVGFILKDCGAKVALVSTPAQYEKIRKVFATTSLESVIVFDPEKPPGSWVTSLEEAYRRGEEAQRREPDRFNRRRGSVGPDSLASVIYTSGTTGDPKGVMLTHANFVSNIETMLSLVPMTAGDVGLSFLPLSHVFERTAEYCYFRIGCTVAYAESIETVPKNLVEVRPTVVAAVPRLFEKFRGRVLDSVRTGSAMKRRLFHWALEKGRRRIGYELAGRPVPLPLAAQCALADRLVFSKIKARLGGRLRFFISGGAPLPRELAEFFFSAGITILEGYGLTETSPVIAINTLDRLRLGTVGQVIPGVTVRIAQDGEILVRGPNVMRGYWNRPGDTKAAIEDGWFHTGDIGFIDKDGFLLITDRKKDLLVTSAGKNVAPQPIESALKSSRFIANAVCIGDRRHYIAALLVPELEALGEWARGRGIPADEPAPALLSRPEVRDLFGREIERATERFAPYERVKKFALLPRDFTIDAGEITPTMKVKRRVILEKYSDLIETLYT